MQAVCSSLAYAGSRAMQLRSCRYFWWVVRTDVDRQKLLMEDLLPPLGNNEEDAAYAFGLFDLDNDGYVVEAEVHSRFQKMYRCASARTLDSRAAPFRTICACLYWSRCDQHLFLRMLHSRSLLRHVR